VVWPQTSSSRNIETLADQVTAPTALSRIRQNATSEAYALRPKAHERGKDGRDSLFRRFGVSAFRRFVVRCLGSFGGSFFARRDREDQIPVARALLPPRQRRASSVAY
jgi:hypothetical protein